MISLTLSGITVVLEESNSLELPRQRVSSGTVQHAATGSAFTTGAVYEDKHIFNFNGIRIDREQKNLLDIIYAEWLHLRRTQQACDIVVTDTSQYFVERFPRTRPIAPTTVAITFPSVGPTHIRYFAQFNCQFTEDLKYTLTKLNELWHVSFVMVETGKLTV